MSDPPNHLGLIWNHSEPLEVPYLPNQFLSWDFFCRFLQQTSSKCQTSCTTWAVKFVTNMVKSTLFLSIKWLTTPWNSCSKISIPYPFFNTNLTVQVVDTYLLLLCPYFCPVLLQLQNEFGPSKSFWSSTNHFGWLQIGLVGSKAFWSGSN